MHYIILLSYDYDGYTMTTTTTKNKTTVVSGDYCGTHWTVAHESQKRSHHTATVASVCNVRARTCVCVRSAAAAATTAAGAAAAATAAERQQRRGRRR